MKAVIDIGKTNVKLHILDDAGIPVTHYSRRNTPVAAHPYPHADVESIWAWLIECFIQFPKTNEISGLIVTTHGATAALVDQIESPNDGTGLALPILDYEYAAVSESDADYQKVRSLFDETYSPNLPAGLNLGRQLFWQSRTFPEAFTSAKAIVMYPQYWAWRFGGELVSEVTSLGCHTDLWAPQRQEFSTQVKRLGWTRLFPKLANAWDSIGTVSQHVSELTGLPTTCEIFAGLHDSNASYLRYLNRTDSSFTVISTGTWTILLDAQGQLERLQQYRDTLTNSDIYGRAVACARYMGGREYEAICQWLGGSTDAPVNELTIQEVVDQNYWVTPDFSEGNGPFGGMTPRASENIPANLAGAVATLYSALMIDQRLSDLGAIGDIIIEGAFLVNPLLCRLVAQLRPSQRVYLSKDTTGTVQGAMSLMAGCDPHTGVLSSPAELETCEPSCFDGLSEYKASWQLRVAENDCIGEK